MEEIGIDLMKQHTTASVAGLESTPFTAESLLENMQKANNRIKKLTHIYVMSSEAIPDDCYGILMLRPEDAKEWRKK